MAEKDDKKRVAKREIIEILANILHGRWESHIGKTEIALAACPKRIPSASHNFLC
jgi:hypothetical protein